jgi:hypothetical protein
VPAAEPTRQHAQHAPDSGAAGTPTGASPGRVPDPGVSGTPRPGRVPDSGAPVTPTSFKTALPRLVAGLALALLVLGLMTVSGGLLGHLGDTSLNTALFGTIWPWALVAAMFALTCRDHPWLPGAALGLLAGTTGLLGGGGGNYPWFLLGMAAVVIAVACQTSPLWLAAAVSVLGAAGLLLVADSASALESISGDIEDVAFIGIAAGLLGLAGYRGWLERAWLGAIAPALLVLDAALHLANAPLFVVHASLAGLIVVPLIATLTSGAARFAGYVTVAAGLLVRANEYVSANEPSFTSVAHVTLPLAAAVVAYFSRSR